MHLLCAYDGPADRRNGVLLMPRACGRYMKPEGLLSAIIAVYPPEGSGVERAGALPGERRPATYEGSRLVGYMLHCCTAALSNSACGKGYLAAASSFHSPAWRTIKCAVRTLLLGLECMLFLLQESDFFKLFDVDGDGLVSFYEYLMLVTFLSIPPEVREWLLAFCRARVALILYPIASGTAVR